MGCGCPRTRSSSPPVGVTMKLLYWAHKHFIISWVIIDVPIITLCICGIIFHLR